MRSVTARQYNTDLRTASQRPNPPRGLTYVAETGYLSWTAPAGTIPFTHYNVRIDDDAGLPAHVLPAGTTRVQILDPCKVTVTAWNDVTRTESAPAYKDITAGWTGGATGGAIKYA